MPPNRRRPTPSPGQAPIRRPKVAGLRNRPGQPAVDPAEQPAVERDSAEPEQESVAEVLDGVLGEPPPVPERTRPADRTPDEPDEPDEPADAADPEYPEDPEATAESESETVRRPRPTPAARPKQHVEGTRPAGKRRATGAARPDDLATAETGAGSRRPDRYSPARGEDRPSRGRAQRLLSVAIVLAVVAVVLAGLAVFFRGKANDLNSGDTNTALTDPAATSQVKGQLTTAIKQTFSYNYTDLDSTEKAVRENLTGKALCEYNLLFGEVKQYAPEQKIVLDTTVRELAVVRIDGDRAEALVYIDQLSTRVDVGKTVAVGGQFAVQARKDGDHWKITEFDMFGQPLFNGKPAPKC